MNSCACFRQGSAWHRKCRRRRGRPKRRKRRGRDWLEKYAFEKNNRRNNSSIKRKSSGQIIFHLPLSTLNSNKANCDVNGMRLTGFPQTQPSWILSFSESFASNDQIEAQPASPQALIAPSIIEQGKFGQFLSLKRTSCLSGKASNLKSEKRKQLIVYFYSQKASIIRLKTRKKNPLNCFIEKKEKKTKKKKFTPKRKDQFSYSNICNLETIIHFVSILILLSCKLTSLNQRRKPQESSSTDKLAKFILNYYFNNWHSAKDTRKRVLYKQRKKEFYETYLLEKKKSYNICLEKQLIKIGRWKLFLQAHFRQQQQQFLAWQLRETVKRDFSKHIISNSNVEASKLRSLSPLRAIISFLEGGPKWMLDLELTRHAWWLKVEEVFSTRLPIVLLTFLLPLVCGLNLTLTLSELQLKRAKDNLEWKEVKEKEKAQRGDKEPGRKRHNNGPQAKSCMIIEPLESKQPLEASAPNLSSIRFRETSLSLQPPFASPPPPPVLLLLPPPPPPLKQPSLEANRCQTNKLVEFCDKKVSKTREWEGHLKEGTTTNGDKVAKEMQVCRMKDSAIVWRQETFELTLAWEQVVFASLMLLIGGSKPLGDKLIERKSVVSDKEACSERFIFLLILSLLHNRPLESFIRVQLKHANSDAASMTPANLSKGYRGCVLAIVVDLIPLKSDCLLNNKNSRQLCELITPVPKKLKLKQRQKHLAQLERRDPIKLECRKHVQGSHSSIESEIKSSLVLLLSSIGIFGSVIHNFICQAQLESTLFMLMHFWLKLNRAGICSEISVSEQDKLRSAKFELVSFELHWYLLREFKWPIGPNWKISEHESKINIKQNSLDTFITNSTLEEVSLRDSNVISSWLSLENFHFQSNNISRRLNCNWLGWQIVSAAINQPTKGDFVKIEACLLVRLYETMWLLAGLLTTVLEGEFGSKVSVPHQWTQFLLLLVALDLLFTELLHFLVIKAVSQLTCSIEGHKLAGQRRNKAGFSIRSECWLKCCGKICVENCCYRADYHNINIAKAKAKTKIGLKGARVEVYDWSYICIDCNHVSFGLCLQTSQPKPTSTDTQTSKPIIQWKRANETCKQLSLAYIWNNKRQQRQSRKALQKATAIDEEEQRLIRLIMGANWRFITKQSTFSKGINFNKPANLCHNVAAKPVKSNHGQQTREPKKIEERIKSQRKKQRDCCHPSAGSNSNFSFSNGASTLDRLEREDCIRQEALSGLPKDQNGQHSKLVRATRRTRAHYIRRRRRYHYKKQACDCYYCYCYYYHPFNFQRQQQLRPRPPQQNSSTRLGQHCNHYHKPDNNLHQSVFPTGHSASFELITDGSGGCVGLPFEFEGVEPRPQCTQKSGLLALRDGNRRRTRRRPLESCLEKATVSLRELERGILLYSSSSSSSSTLSLSASNLARRFCLLAFSFAFVFILCFNSTTMNVGAEIQSGLWRSIIEQDAGGWPNEKGPSTSLPQVIMRPNNMERRRASLPMKVSHNLSDAGLSSRLNNDNNNNNNDNNADDNDDNMSLEFSSIDNFYGCNDNYNNIDDQRVTRRPSLPNKLVVKAIKLNSPATSKQVAFKGDKISKGQRVTNSVDFANNNNNNNNKGTYNKLDGHIRHSPTKQQRKVALHKLHIKHNNGDSLANPLSGFSDQIERIQLESVRSKRTRVATRNIAQFKKLYQLHPRLPTIDNQPSTFPWDKDEEVIKIEKEDNEQLDENPQLKLAQLSLQPAGSPLLQAPPPNLRSPPLMPNKSQHFRSTHSSHEQAQTGSSNGTLDRSPEAMAVATLSDLIDTGNKGSRVARSLARERHGAILLSDSRRLAAAVAAAAANKPIGLQQNNRAGDDATNNPSFGMSCSPECICTWKNGKQFADCSRNNTKKQQETTLKAIPSNLDPLLQILNLSGNHLPHLAARAFVSLNLNNLQRVYMSNCQMESVHLEAFENLKLIVELDFSWNKLNLIPLAQMKQLSLMRKLTMRGNPLYSLTDATFASNSPPGSKLDNEAPRDVDKNASQASLGGQPKATSKAEQLFETYPNIANLLDVDLDQLDKNSADWSVVSSSWSSSSIYSNSLMETFDNQENSTDIVKSTLDKEESKKEKTSSQLSLGSTFKQLQELDFGHCQLQYIKWTTLKSLNQLKRLLLDGNQLSQLSGQLVAILPSNLHQLSLHQNPWICDCRLLALKRWLMSTNTALDAPATCFLQTSKASQSQSMSRLRKSKEIKLPIADSTSFSSATLDEEPPLRILSLDQMTLDDFVCPPQAEAAASDFLQDNSKASRLSLPEVDNLLNAVDVDQSGSLISSQLNGRSLMASVFDYLRPTLVSPSNSNQDSYRKTNMPSKVSPKSTTVQTTGQNRELIQATEEDKVSLNCSFLAYPESSLDIVWLVDYSHRQLSNNSQINKTGQRTVVLYDSKLHQAAFNNNNNNNLTNDDGNVEEDNENSFNSEFDSDARSQQRQVWQEVNLYGSRVVVRESHASDPATNDQPSLFKSSQVIIRSAHVDDSARYKCIAINRAGNASFEYSLKVKSSPKGETNPPGASSTASIAASGPILSGSSRDQRANNINSNNIFKLEHQLNNIDKIKLAAQPATQTIQSLNQENSLTLYKVFKGIFSLQTVLVIAFGLMTGVTIAFLIVCIYNYQIKPAPAPSLPTVNLALANGFALKNQVETSSTSSTNYDHQFGITTGGGRPPLQQQNHTTTTISPSITAYCDPLTGQSPVHLLTDGSQRSSIQTGSLANQTINQPSRQNNSVPVVMMDMNVGAFDLFANMI